MNACGDDQPSPEGGCTSAQSLLRDLWVDGDLGALPLRGIRSRKGDDSPGSPAAEAPADRSCAGRGSPPRSRREGRVDTAVLRHIEDCPVCRREADDLDRLGTSLRLGLESLCGAIAETMDQDIEGTLEKLREESGQARFLRRARRSLRLVLWISLLAFTLLASIGLAVAVYQALKGL